LTPDDTSYYVLSDTEADIWLNAAHESATITDLCKPVRELRSQ
jgi:hypothetical protein